MADLSPEKKDEILAVDRDPFMPESAKAEAVARVVLRPAEEQVEKELELRDLRVIWGSDQEDLKAQAAREIASPKTPKERQRSVKEIRKAFETRDLEFQRAFEEAKIRPDAISRPALESGVLPTAAFAPGKMEPGVSGFDFRKFQSKLGQKGVVELLRRHPELLKLMGDFDE